MSLEQCMEYLGRYGPAQILTYFLVTIFWAFPSQWQTMVIIFIGYQNEYHCKGREGIPLNQSVPYEEDFSGNVGPSKCLRYVNYSISNETEACTEWTYRPDYFVEPNGTVMMEWDLTCTKNDRIELSQTLFSVGAIVGMLVFSPIGDYFGRKIIFFLAQLLMCVFGIAMAFSPNYETFAACQFLSAMMAAGNDLAGFIISCEIFPTPARSTVTICHYFFTCGGFLTLDLFAYLIRDWRKLQLAISVTPLITLLYWPFMPESLRWLVANGRYEEAQKWLDRAGRINGKKLPPGLLMAPEPGEKQDTKDDVRPTLLRYYSNPRTCRYGFIMIFLLITSTLLYFGLAYLTQYLPGDLYQTFALLTAIEIPGIFAAIFLMKYVGRRYPLSGFMLWGAIFLIAAAAIQVSNIEFSNPESKGQLVTWLAIFGKFGVAAAWACVLLYIQELYPTNMRSQGMGVTSSLGFLGGIAAPWVVYLEKYTALYVPFLIFAALAIISAGLVLCVPETHGRNLPVSIEEVASWPLTLTPEEKMEVKKFGKVGGDTAMEVKVVPEGEVNPGFITDKSEITHM